MPLARQGEKEQSRQIRKIETRLAIGVAMIRISSLISNFNNKNKNTERPKVDDYPGHSARNYSSNVDTSTKL